MTGPAEGPTPLPRLRAVGDRAVLVDCGDLDDALRMFAALDAARRAGELDVDDLVPAASTVLIRGGEAASARRPATGLAERLAHLVARSPGGTAPAADAREVEIPVTYDGADLAEVARLTGLGVDEVVARHTAAGYTVAFTGFAPGFAYLAGGDPALEVPRREAPRPRIPAGSVGLAGRFSGVYPRQSPGGWQLIGRTHLPMWDLDREPPALLTPGTRVRFVVRRAAAATRPPTVTAARAQVSLGTPALTIVEPALPTLVQDAGRPGLAALGVSTSGAADRGALARANRLVGNLPGAAALELGQGRFLADADATVVLALAGAPRAAWIEGPAGARRVDPDRGFRIDAGERLELASPDRGLRTVLALRGSVAAPLTLGSAARDTLAGLGPEALAAGDTVRAGAAPGATPVGAPEPWPDPPPAPGETASLEVIPGPRDDWFGEAGLTRLCSQDWRVSPDSDRVGCRLIGEALHRRPECAARELPSEGMVRGAIQVPPGGQPVLLLADHPLTGGYPVIAVVRRTDVDRTAQLRPGALVRFRIRRPARLADT